MVYFKENYCFSRFRFPRGLNFFRVDRGQDANLYFLKKPIELMTFWEWGSGPNPTSGSAHSLNF